VFTIIRSGYNPRCALETDDGAQNRFEKICEIIAQCRLGVHDISKIGLDKKSRLPRFNMPLELGVFLAAKRFGGQKQKAKRCLIFDSDPYRYQAFISDIAGQDIHSHSGKLELLIKETASWLRADSKNPAIPGGQIISAEYGQFMRNLPKICKDRKLATTELTYADFATLAAEWVAQLR
jgi:hypothetical protein